MEISIINPRGHRTAVIFTGSHYYFQSDFAGLFAIAERVSLDYKTNETHFKLTYGNTNLVGCSLGGSQTAAVAKAFIRKGENRYVKTKVVFDEEVFEELDRAKYLDVSAINR